MTVSSRVSFVVPVKNDEVRLRTLIASIRAAEQASGEPAEIIVVDNHSTDGSAATAAALGARVEQVLGDSVAGLRNVGAEHAQGDLLAFVDADHSIDRRWLTVAGEIFQNPQVAAAGALCSAPDTGTWVQAAYDRLRRRSPEVTQAAWLGAGNLLVRRSVFATVGGFDVSLQTCEDVDLCWRLRASGYIILNDDRLKNVHWGDPSTIAALFWGELWRGQDNLRVSLRQGMQEVLSPSVMMPVANLAALVAIASSPVMSGGLRWTVLGAALAIIGATIAVRAVRMWMVPDQGRRSGIGAIGAVAAVYEVARALSLLGIGGHTTRRSGLKRHEPANQSS